MEKQKQTPVVIFGGTSEGRELAEYAQEYQIPVMVSVVSGYGESLLQESAVVRVHTGALKEEDMRAFLMETGTKLVMDATHPYARVVTEQVSSLCAALQIPYKRILRDPSQVEMEQNGSGAGLFLADSIEEAVNYLKADDRPVLLTTGSKELEKFVADPACKDRIYARVLPDSQVLKKCEELGIRGAHVIAMQGPFSTELNTALLRTAHAGWLVTKEAGKRGGFAEKLEAARACGVSVIVIRRPVQEEGISLNEAKQLMDAYRISKRQEKKENPLPDKTSETGARSLSLIGMGMGGGRQLTLEALDALKQCDAVFGASRMLRDVEKWICGKQQEAFYQPDQILDWLETHPQVSHAAVICSGDTGFYSGSGSMMRELHTRWPQETACPYQVQVYPGISSVSALAARFQISWEDACLASAHGRDCDVAELVKQHKLVFLLLDSSQNLKTICQTLTAAGLGKTRIFAGARMGYEEEQNICGMAEELTDQETDSLTAVFLERNEE